MPAICIEIHQTNAAMEKMTINRSRCDARALAQIM